MPGFGLALSRSLASAGIRSSDGKHCGDCAQDAHSEMKEGADPHVARIAAAEGKPGKDGWNCQHPGDQPRAEVARLWGCIIFHGTRMKVGLSVCKGADAARM